jgi:serine/threonine protein kinase
MIVATEEGSESAKVLDFGVARLLGDLQPEAALAAPVIEQRQGTQSGTLIGTPCYMAPEQINFAFKIGPEADIWALGIVAYECLIGKPPFEADSLDGILSKVVKREYVPAALQDPSISMAFDGWFRTACAMDPDQRFRRASSAVAELARALGVDLATVKGQESHEQSSTSQAPTDPLAVTIGPEVPGAEEIAPPSRALSTVDIIAICMVVLALAVTLFLVTRSGFR